jgi:predicted outer membrane repeat protein
MENCTVQGNRALGKAGGLFVACEGAARLINCTFSGNHAERNGGGVYVKGDAKIEHCTISGNTTKQLGGGLYVRSQARLANSLIAGNTRGDVILGGPGDYRGKGTLDANVQSWIADGSCDSDFSGDPLLGRLADNGGDTLTHALLPTSPAIDGIPAAACSLRHDQRGLSRPVQVGSGQPLCDVGAYEAQP